MKKGKGTMKKLFKWIFVYNKFSLLGILSLLIRIGALVLYIYKPEIFVKYEIGFEELLGAISPFVIWAITTITKRGFESEKTWIERHADNISRKEEDRKAKEELKELIKHNVLIDRAIKPVLRDINDIIVNGLITRIENQKVSGVQNSYTPLNRNIPSLTVEYIKTLLGEEAYEVLLDKLDQIAVEYGLIEILKNDKGEEEYINLIVEELEK